MLYRVCGRRILRINSRAYERFFTAVHVVRFLTLRGRTSRLVMYGLAIFVDVLVNTHSFLCVFPIIPKFLGKDAGRQIETYSFHSNT